MDKIDVFDVQIPDGRQVRLHDVADTKVMSEFLHREGGRYWTTIDGLTYSHH